MNKRRRLLAMLAALILIFCTAALPVSAKSFAEMRNETPKYTTNNPAAAASRKAEASSLEKAFSKSEADYSKKHHNNSVYAQRPGNAYQDTNNDGKATGNERSNDVKKADDDDYDPAIYHNPTPDGTPRKNGDGHCLGAYYFFKNADAYSLGGGMAQTFWPFLIKFFYWCARTFQNVFYYNSFNTLNFIGTKNAGWHAIYGKSGFTTLLLGLLTVSIVAYGIYIFLHYDSMSGHGKDLAKQILALICLLVGLPSLLGFGNLLLQDEVRGFSDNKKNGTSSETLTVDTVMRRYTIDWLYLAACGNLTKYGNVYDGHGVKVVEDKGTYETPDLGTDAAFKACSEKTAQLGPDAIPYDEMITSKGIEDFESSASQYAKTHDKGKYDYTIPDDVKNCLFKYNSSQPPKEVLDQDPEGMKAFTTLVNGKGPWYRYHYMVAPMLLFFAAIALVTILASVRILRLVFDLAFSGVIAPLFAVTDFISGGARTKEIVKNIISIYLALMFIPVLIGLYNLGVQWVIGAGFSEFFKAFVLVIWSWATIDGPDILKKLIGQDVGMHDGWRAAMAANGLAKSAVNVGKQTAGAVKRHHQNRMDSMLAGHEIASGKDREALGAGTADENALHGPGEQGEQSSKDKLNSHNSGKPGDETEVGANDGEKPEPKDGGDGAAQQIPDAADQGDDAMAGVMVGAGGDSDGSDKDRDDGQAREQAFGHGGGSDELEAGDEPLPNVNAQGGEDTMAFAAIKTSSRNSKKAEADLPQDSGGRTEATAQSDEKDSGNRGSTSAELKKEQTAALARTADSMRKNNPAGGNKQGSKKAQATGSSGYQKAQNRMQQSLKKAGYSKEAAAAGAKAAAKYGGGMTTARAAADAFDASAKNSVRELGGTTGGNTKNGTRPEAAIGGHSAVAGLPAGDQADVLSQANQAADNRAQELASAFQASPEQKMDAYSSQQAAEAPSPSDNYAEGAVGIASEIGSNLGFQQSQMDTMAQRTSEAMNNHLAAAPDDQAGAYEAGVNAAQSYAQSVIDRGAAVPGTVSSEANAYGNTVPGATVQPALNERTQQPFSAPQTQRREKVPVGNRSQNRYEGARKPAAQVVAQSSATPIINPKTGERMGIMPKMHPAKEAAKGYYEGRMKIRTSQFPGGHSHGNATKRRTGVVAGAGRLVRAQHYNHVARKNNRQYNKLLEAANSKKK